MHGTRRRGEVGGPAASASIRLPLPPSVAALADSLGLDARIAVTADIDTTGRLATRWLLAAPGRLVLIAIDGDTATLTEELDLAQCADWRLEQGVGTKLLMARVRGEERLVARFTNAQANRFAKARARLEAWGQGEQLDKVDEPSDDSQDCPRCHRPLPEHSRVCPRCFSRRHALARLGRYIGPHLPKMAQLLALMGAGMVLSLINPQFNGLLFDRVLAPSDHSTHQAGRLVSWMLTAQTREGALGQIVLLMLVSGVLGAAFTAARGRLAAWLAYYVVHDIRLELYTHLQLLTLRYFDKRQTGALMSRVTNDTRAMQGFLIDGFQNLVINALTLVVVGPLLLLSNWRLALLILVPLPLVTVLATAFWKRVRRLYSRLWRRWERLSATISDSLGGVKVVKAFAAEQREIGRFERDSLLTAEAGTAANALRATISPWLGFVVTSSSLMVWYFGGRQVLGEHMSPGQLVQFFIYLGMIYGPIQWISDLFNWFQETLAAAERVWEVLDEATDMPLLAEPVMLDDVAGRVTFDHVTFGYEPHEPVLHDICLDVQPGEMIGLVGHSGAGKSTLINLICRFYDVDEGAMKIDDVDIRQIGLSQYRRSVGVVPQDSFLFNGSIYDNIAYGHPDATPEELFTAAKAANAHDFIVELPDGYDTLVGEHGHRLSGGERQRVSIARAILHDPKVLILDEATASVDTRTERMIQQALERLVRGRTTFAIAHRLSTLRNADRLVVIEKGKIAEIGTHDELLHKEGGVFRKLVDMQNDMNRITYIGG